MRDKIFETEKRIIGQLIGYYRRKEHITIDTFLLNNTSYFNDYCLDCNKCHEKEFICDPKTLRKIEKGYVVSNECYYFKLCSHLGYTLILDRVLFKKINEYGNKIYTYLTYYSYSKLKELYNKISQDLEKYPNVIYASEMLHLYYDILLLEIDEVIPNDQQIQLYYFLLDKVTSPNQLLILNLFEKMNHYNELISNNYPVIQEKYKSCYDDPLFFYSKLIHLSYNDLLNMHLKILDILKKDTNHLYIYQLFCILDTLAFVQFNLEAYNNAYETMLKCIALVENNLDLNEKRLSNCYRKMGMITYELGKYKDTIAYFEKAMQYSSNLGMMVVLFINSLEKTGQIEKLKQMLYNKNIFIKKNKKEKIVWIYYLKKYSSKKLTKSQISELEDYICLELKQNIIKHSPIFEKIFREELLDWVSQTTNYKKIYLFDQK